MAQGQGDSNPHRRPGAPLVIGLVNSMPGEALRHTERQFRDILSGATSSLDVQLRLFTLDPAHAARGDYHDISTLDRAGIDGLIVTGMPPRAAALRDEPCWNKLAGLVDIAVEQAIPTVWSCLAAHAAVLHLDGIERRRLPAKLSGVVECTRSDAAHPYVFQLPRRWRMPHSRYNELPAEALAARGYEVLSSSDDAGADLFAKDAGAPFLFCQGHPEYDADTLLREYHRDIRQFLSGGRNDYPDAPRGYFPAEVAPLLDEFRARCLRDRQPGTIGSFPMRDCFAGVVHSWRDLALDLYANWLGDVARRTERPAETGAPAWSNRRAQRPAVAPASEPQARAG